MSRSSIRDLIELARRNDPEWQQKEADEVVGYPTKNPSVAPAPVMGEEGQNPAQRQMERANLNPADEVLGDDAESTRVKLEQKIMRMAGQQIEAASKGEDPEEMPNYALRPPAGETVATPAAPPGMGGPGIAPEGEMASKVSSAIVGTSEELYNQTLQQAEEAYRLGDAESAQKLANMAEGYRQIFETHAQSAEYQKRASAKALIAGLVGNQIEDEYYAKEASDEEIDAETEYLLLNKLADDHMDLGRLAGASHVEELRKWASEEFYPGIQEAILDLFTPEDE